MSESTLIISKMSMPKGGDLQKAAFQFLEKLTTDDSLPGLHIEPITNSRDPRVRTGRVTQQYRAVLFRLDIASQPAYVFIGVWNHDDAIKKAQTAELTMNPINGVAEFRFVDPDNPPAAEPSSMATKPTEPEVPVLIGYSAAELHESLGLDLDLAEAAARATSDDALMALVEHAVEWQGLALIELAGGTAIDVVKEKLGLDVVDEPTDDKTEDQRILDALRHPAAQVSFAYVEGHDELRRVIEGGDLAAWQVFLHPAQRRYVDKSNSGPFRLSGGAGTGKTVVLIHRAARLAEETPPSRTLLSTYTTNLANELDRAVRQLAPDLTRAAHLGDAGVYVGGIDALASAVIKSAGQNISSARERLLGSPSGAVTKRTDRTAGWRSAIEDAGSDLPEPLRTQAFFDAEYSLVVLPQRLTSLADYLKTRRPGRGVRLNRAERTVVWQVIESYRVSARAAGTIDFSEAAALAAVHLELAAERGEGHLLDHVLVDEGQDLTPTHWQLIRALVAEAADDLFIAEDSHQRIYGHKITLGRLGIKIVGRSRRLTLNYRTTAQNLRFGMRILQPGEFSDLEASGEDASGYRSARSGPDVRMDPYDTLAKELDGAAETVRRWVDDAVSRGAPRESIAILVRDRYDRDRVVSGLAERGVTIRAVDRESVQPGTPVAMTMHRAKGTEFYKVLLFGISASSMPKGFSDYDFSEDEKSDAWLRERSLLYVAATRARDELVVSWNKGSSPLLPDGSGA